MSARVINSAKNDPTVSKSGSWKSYSTAFLAGLVLIAGAALFLMRQDYLATRDLWTSRLSGAALHRAWMVQVSLEQSQDDVRLLAAFPPTAELLAFGSERSTSPARSASRRDVAWLFNSYRKIFEYAAIYLLDNQGQIVLEDAAGPSWHKVFEHPLLKKTAREVTRSGQYAVTVVQASEAELALAFTMPITASRPGPQDGARNPIGVLVILDPIARELVPLIIAGDITTRTGETMLIHLGDGVAQYASETRFTPDSRRSHVSDSLLRGASSAVENQGVVTSFIDYRGVNVQAAMQKIPEIASVVVSKIDMEEAFASFYRTLRFQIMAGIAVLLAYTGFLLLHRRNTIAQEMKETLSRQDIVKQILETEVAERTNQLGTANQQLQLELAERQRAEDEVRRLNAELEQRVRDRTAELEFTNKELEAFSYSVSHDLRSPARAASGFAAILLEDYGSQLPAEAHRCLQEIQGNAARMEELIGGLLAFSRLGRQDLYKQPVLPADLVSEVLKNLQTEYEGRQIEFVVGELPPCEADRLLLKQVFTNLLSNALKYSRTRDVSRIEVGSEGPVYYVRDNGVGFDMRYADKLFVVFNRLHRVSEFEGIGIGLANVHRIVQRHGGRVWANAVVDHGATFYFTLAPEQQS